MAKLIVEENLKSKHPDSFKVLKSYGYRFLGYEEGNDPSPVEVFSRGDSNNVHIDDSGRWLHYHDLHGEDTRGKSHSDLKVHLNKVHRLL